MGTNNGYQLHKWERDEVASGEVLPLVSWTATSIIYTSVFSSSQRLQVEGSDRNDKDSSCLSEKDVRTPCWGLFDMKWATSEEMKQQII